MSVAGSVRGQGEDRCESGGEHCVSVAGSMHGLADEL